MGVDKQTVKRNLKLPKHFTEGTPGFTRDTMFHNGDAQEMPAMSFNFVPVPPASPEALKT